MSALPETVESNEIDQDALHSAIDHCCDRIAPTWPLDRMIAVNPYWFRTDQLFDEVHRQLASLAGSTLYMPLSYYEQKWKSGDIAEMDLAQAATEMGLAMTPDQAVKGLTNEHKEAIPLPLLSDILDQQRDLQKEPAWCDTITHQVSQFCAAYFDLDQSDWRADHEQALYAGWQSIMAHDRSVTLLMKAPQVREAASALMHDPIQQIGNALHQLGVEVAAWPSFLQAVLMRINGWASWCAYRRWQARLAGSDDETLVQLLAVRLSWECLIDDGQRHAGSHWHRWHGAMEAHLQAPEPAETSLCALWQRAHEVAYQKTLVARLTAGSGSDQTTKAEPSVQAIFCIDVRSEVFRRQLEATSDRVSTLGFAGFFGLPASYRPLGSAIARPQLPGLLAPAFELSDSSGSPDQDLQIQKRRENRLERASGWNPINTMPASAFALVETLGLSYVGKLVKRSLPEWIPAKSASAAGLDATDVQALRPYFGNDTAGGIEAQCSLAVKILDAMNLGAEPARLVALIGHGSATQNNPQKAGLDCGACCGQTGEVNARALADLLNRTEVREGIKRLGKALPETTWFVAGLHNTTTDDVTLFDVTRVPDSHRADLKEFEELLAEAGGRARQERALALGLASFQNSPEKLSARVRQRASDWAQTRPEWGLANNAAFIIARRERTRGVDLNGRAFLHEYDARLDQDGALLESIMTAPMIVTHWINMQYYASTVDPLRYGSGNKILHNVVAGRIGVFEGNGGDLRIGLARQSVQDGQQWRHTPLRLTVVIDAPRQHIQAVIDQHPTVRNLVHNQWLYLVRLGDDQVEYYRNGVWQA